MTTFKRSKQQQEIVDASKSKDSFVVNALAGTGKTTTLKQICIEHPDRQYLYVAFNRSVKEDFIISMKKEKITNVHAMTGDAIALSYIQNIKYAPLNLKAIDRVTDGLKNSKDIFKHFEFEKLKLKERADSKGEKVQKEEVLSEVETISYLKKGIRNFCISTDTKILDRHFDDYEASETALYYADILWNDYQNASSGELRLSFEILFKMFAMDKPSMKMLYSPNDTRVFDALLIDEAQDTNPVAGELYKSQTDIQVIYVGDPNQAIYGFRGAEDEMEKRSDLKFYPLNQSWRFGSNIADISNKALNRLNSKVLLEGMSSDPGIVYKGVMENPDIIICRTNVGCLTSIFSLLSEGIKPKLNKDTKKEIISIVKTLGYLANQLEKTVIHEELEDYKSLDEVEKDIEVGVLPKKFDIILKKIIGEKHAPIYNGAQLILDTIDTLSKKYKTGPEVSTVHKAKGGEWDRVQIYDDFFWPRWDFEKKEVVENRPELMLIYVALTRAKKEIAYSDSISHIMLSYEQLRNHLKNKYDKSS